MRSQSYSHTWGRATTRSVAEAEPGGCSEGRWRSLPCAQQKCVDMRARTPRFVCGGDNYLFILLDGISLVRAIALPVAAAAAATAAIAALLLLLAICWNLPRSKFCNK